MAERSPRRVRKLLICLKERTCRSTSGSNKSSRCWQSPGRTEKVCLLISARRFVLTRMESGVSTSISAHLVLFICPVKTWRRITWAAFTFLFLSKLYLALQCKKVMAVVTLKYHTMKKITLKVFRNKQSKFCSFIRDKKKICYLPCKTGINCKSESFVILKNAFYV